MTALKQYDRLESGGLWRAEAEAQRRDVTVSFGDATLVISDGAGRPLTHWSLAAVERENPSERPAIFKPAADADETLEIDDPLMIEAIETVRKSVARSRPRPKRLRYLTTAVVAFGIVSAGVFWLPGALRDQAAAVIPHAKRAEIGGTVLGHLQRKHGQRCRGTAGTAALDRLHRRLLGPDAAGQIVVLPLGFASAIALPGSIIAVDPTLVQSVDDPAITAGYVLAAHAARRVTDPVSTILADAPISVTAKLLTTSDITPAVLRGYAETMSPPTPPYDELRAAFDLAQVQATPYATHRVADGAPLEALITEDPMIGRDASQVMTDSDWVALQGICDL